MGLFRQLFSTQCNLTAGVKKVPVSVVVWSSLLQADRPRARSRSRGGEEEQLCAGRQVTVFPRMAKNLRDEWRWEVVNTSHKALLK